jgi:chemotaxis protein methyltransferase CheR
VTDADCVAFLQWALPRLGLSWQGFRKPRHQVCKRIARRVEGLGLAGLEAYRARLEADPAEWSVLDELCHVTISRFLRDRGLWALLEAEVMPVLARAAGSRDPPSLEVWSAGCASGEEPYTLAVVWKLGLERRFPRVELRLVATDVDDSVLARGSTACYPASSLRELSADRRAAAFEERAGLFCLRPEFRQAVQLLHHDVRTPPPGGPYDLVLCRNVAFTYFAPELQRETAAMLTAALRPGGALVLGAHERLPAGTTGFEPWPGAAPILRHSTAA